MQLPFKIGSSNTIQVISIELTEEAPIYNYGLFNVKNSRFKAQRLERFYSIDELLSSIHKKTAILLHFFGKGILNRRIAPEPDYLDKLLMDANPNDFFINYTDKFNHRFISFTRKNILEDYIQLFSAVKDFILNTTIGPFHLIHSTLKELYEAPLIHFYEDAPNSINFKPVTGVSSTFNFKHVAYGHTIYGAILAYLYLSQATIPSVYTEEEVKARKVNYRDKKQFEKIGVGVLAFFLIALSINYLYQGQIHKANASLEDEIMIFSDQLSKIDRIDQEIQRKTQLIQSSGILNHQFISYYLDEIGASLIPSIRLTEIQAFPVEKKLKQKVRPIFEQQNIYISGTTTNSYELDRWILILNKFDWTKNIEILSFDKPNDAIGIFKIKLALQKK